MGRRESRGRETLAVVQERKDGGLRYRTYTYSRDEGGTDLKAISEAELIDGDRIQLDLRLREEDVRLMFRFLV